MFSALKRRWTAWQSLRSFYRSNVISGLLVMVVTLLLLGPIAVNTPALRVYIGWVLVIMLIHYVGSVVTGYFAEEINKCQEDIIASYKSQFESAERIIQWVKHLERSMASVQTGQNLH